MSSQAEITARLIEAREAKGLSGAQLARLLGMSQQKYHPYEHEREMKASMIVQVCAVLECSPSWLLGVQEEGPHLPPESELLKALKREFAKLNNRGQQKAVDNTRDLTYLPEYRKRTDPEVLDAESGERRTA